MQLMNASNNLKTAGNEPKAEETPEVNEVRLENTVKNEEPTILNQKEIEKEPIIEKGDRIEGNSGKEASTNKAPNADTSDIADTRPSFENPVKASKLHKKLGEKLFATYQWVEKSIVNLKDISEYNKIKTIIANKFKDSPEEFKELISKLNKKAKEMGLDVVENSIDRTARLGKSLSKFYTKMENTISKMKSEKEFSKILKKITTQFAGYYDDMKALLEKLYAKAKTLGLTVKESIHDVYSRVGISTDKVSIKQKVDNFFESLLSDD